jgi:hypothetical protein
MRWFDRSFIGLGAALALLGSATAASADALVVRARGPSATRFPPGSTLDVNRSVVLRASDVLVLLDERGTWTLSGPGTFPVRMVARPAAQRQLQLADLMNQRRRSRIGAVRSVTATSTKRPNLWLVDTAQAGPACIVDPAAVTLWRADGKDAGKTQIAGPGGTSAEIEWASGQTLHPWPATLPVTADGAYTLTGAGTATPTALTLKPLAPVPTTVTETGKALIAAGCQQQMDLFAAELGQADEKAPAS